LHGRNKIVFLQWQIPALWPSGQQQHSIYIVVPRKVAEVIVLIFELNSVHQATLLEAFPFVGSPIIVGSTFIMEAPKRS
jgi:hypothetical protein